MKKLFLRFKENICLYGLLIFGFLLRLIYIFNFTKPESYLWSDPGGYDSRALEMANGVHIMFSTYFPPLFHMFLSLIYRPLIWLGLESWRIKIDIIIFALFYTLGFWCIYQITKKLFSKKIGLIVLAILIFWYPLIFLNYLVMSENLFFPLVFMGLYFLIVKPLKPSTGLWLGLLWGFALLSRPIFALALPLFVLWGLYYKLNWRFLINFTITVAIIVASMMAFNFYYTDGAEKSISSNGGVGFAMLWCDAKSIQFSNGNYYYWFAPPANADYPESKRIFTTVPFENQKYYYQMGLNCLKEHPEKLITNFSSVIKLFHSQLFPTISNIPFWENFRAIFKILTGLLFVLGLSTIIGLFSKKLKIDEPIKKYFYLFALIISSLIATVYLQNVGEERYLIPYAPLLIILTIPLLLFLLKRKYINDYVIVLIALSLISLATRLSLFNFQSADYFNFLKPWYDFLKTHGLISFKYGFYDLTPLYVHALGLFSYLSIPSLYAIKIISIIFDFILAGMVFLIVRKKYKNNFKIPVFSFILTLLLPTVIINGAYWGQNDVIYTSFLIASVYFLLKNKPLASLILYAISFSLKLQSIFLLPLFIILLLKRKIKPLYFLTIPLVYFITIVPSLLLGRPLKDLLLIYFQQAKNYNYLSLSAPTLYQWLPQNQFDLFYKAGIFFAIAVITILIYVIYKNREEIKDNQIIKIAFLSVILVPFLLPKMHERYFFPADIFSIVFAFYFPRYFYFPVAMQVVSFLSYGPFLWGKNPNFPLLSFTVMIIILITAYDLFKNLYQKNKDIKSDFSVN